MDTIRRDPKFNEISKHGKVFVDEKKRKGLQGVPLVSEAENKVRYLVVTWTCMSNTTVVLFKSRQY